MKSLFSFSSAEKIEAIIFYRDVRRIQLGCYSTKASFNQYAVNQHRDTPCIGSVMLFIVFCVAWRQREKTERESGNNSLFRDCRFFCF